MFAVQNKAQVDRVKLNQICLGDDASENSSKLTFSSNEYSEAVTELEQVMPTEVAKEVMDLFKRAQRMNESPVECAKFLVICD